MAPEVMSQGKVTGKCDVYTFGSILWRFESGGKLPFENVERSWELMSRVMGGERPSIPEHTNSKMANLITKCWDQDPYIRLTFVDIASELLSFA